VAYLIDVEDESGQRLAGFAVLRDHYRFPDGSRVIIRTDVAWCRGCRDFALVERLLAADELADEAEEWFYLKYPEERTPYMQRSMREAMVAQQKTNVARYRALLDYLPHRKSPPRCLTCGGTDFVRYAEPGGPWYEHPERPGRFRIVCNGHIDHTTFAYYDPEGRRLPAL
jgi:hypothetical protein